MSYSTSEARISEVVKAIDEGASRLNKLHSESERIVSRIKGVIDGVGGLEAEIDTGAQTGDPLWQRLQQRKNQVKADMLTLRSAAEAIEQGIRSALP